MHSIVSLLGFCFFWYVVSVCAILFVSDNIVRKRRQSKSMDKEWLNRLRSDREIRDRTSQL